MLPITVPDTFRIIAHRGASAYAPENTFAAFDLAQRMGIREVELDTQLTSDGVVAICHDATLARYGHGVRVVEEMAWAELAALDMGSWFSPFLFGGERMITLEDLLARYGDTFIYHVEIKGKAAALPATVHEILARHSLLGRSIITSFRYSALEAMRAIDSDLRLGWLVRRVDAETLSKAEAIGLFQLGPFAGITSAAQTERARALVEEVRAWGLSGETVAGQWAEVIELVEQVVAADCDGVTINWPDWLRHAGN